MLSVILALDRHIYLLTICVATLNLNAVSLKQMFYQVSIDGWITGRH